MSDTPAAPKSHKGLHFFFGFLTGFFSFIIVTVVALVVLVSAFSPVINKKVEGLLEDYASQSASSTLNINVAIDLKAIRYETDAGTNWFYAIGNATKNNGTGTVYAIELGYNVTDDSLAKLEKHVGNNGDKTKDLSDNYSLKAMVYIILVASDASSKPEVIIFDGVTYPWTLEGTSASAVSSLSLSL